MGYSQNVVKKVREEFENKRQRSVLLAEARSAEACAKCPELLKINHALSLTGLSVFRASLDGTDGLEEKISAIKEENLRLQNEKRQLLKKNGFPEDYTDIKYECELCQDTGYIGVKMCSCMRRALVREAYNSSGLGKALTEQTFESFELDYYSDESTDGKPSPRRVMSNILDKSKKFVDEFGTNGSDLSLLFMGSTGLGKTHITTAIAKGVIDKGFDVVYESAQSIVGAFEQQRFEKNEKASFDVNRYYDCDLLIIDDLGTEFKSSYTQTVLYDLLNTRINNCKSMIFSTNLDEIGTLLKTYDARITSRLIGAFKMFKFEGKDIRILKARQNANDRKR